MDENSTGVSSVCVCVGVRFRSKWGIASFITICRIHAMLASTRLDKNHAGQNFFFFPPFLFSNFSRKSPDGQSPARGRARGLASREDPSLPLLQLLDRPSHMLFPCSFCIKARPVLLLFGTYFPPFSHNPVLCRNAALSQLCVLSQPSCVDLTRQSQTCWRQPPDVIHSPPAPSPPRADGPALAREALGAPIGRARPSLTRVDWGWWGGGVRRIFEPLHTAAARETFCSPCGGCKQSPARAHTQCTGAFPSSPVSANYRGGTEPQVCGACRHISPLDQEVAKQSHV